MKAKFAKSFENPDKNIYATLSHTFSFRNNLVILRNALSKWACWHSVKQSSLQTLQAAAIDNVGSFCVLSSLHPTSKGSGKRDAL
jgi:hypothetical protein